MMCAFGARRNPGFYAAQENLERGQHRVGCVGGDPGAAAGRRAGWWVCRCSPCSPAPWSPTYHTGSLIYVKKVDPLTVQAGEVITFMLDEDTVATHRVVEVVPDEEDASVVRFRTKGDANDSEDGGLVHSNNLLGTPVFTIPYLGYVANYIQHPPGMYVAIAGAAVLLILVFLPDVFAKDGEGKKKSGKAGKDSDGSARRRTAPRRTRPTRLPINEKEVSNMKKFKALLVVACALLLVAASVFGTMAYLTSTDTVTNTFTVGKVKITLDEAKVDLNGTAVTPDERVKNNSYKLMPGHSYTKDPTVHVDAASEDSWIFVKVENGIAAFEAATSSEEGGYKKIADQIVAKAGRLLMALPACITNPMTRALPAQIL